MKSIGAVINAIILRRLLTVALLLLLIGIGGGFYFVYTSLEESAEETAAAQLEAKSTDLHLEQLMETRRQLDLSTEAREKAQKIVADSRSYEYQNQIIADLTAYANQSNLDAVSFSFLGGTGSTQSAPSESTEGAEAANPEAGGASANINSVLVSVGLSGDTSYLSLLNFVNLIEQNLTRMQVTSIALSDSNSVQADGSSVQSLNIEVYVR